MAQSEGLSSALRITDINDFLTPSAACVLPVGGGALPNADDSSVFRTPSEPEGSVLAPIVPVQKTSSSLSRAKVTVSDCLSCSGCVTSAETVLLSSENVDALKKFMLEDTSQRGQFFSIVALSQQSVASLAVHYGLSLTSTAKKLATFLKYDLGFDAVVDLSFARHIALLQAKEEFLARYRAGKPLTITSACPGWLTYAEKTQQVNVLEHISRVRSPQGILGAIAEHLRPEQDSRQLWIATVMMCHDKKLEASRPDLMRKAKGSELKKEVDCVLSTGELLDLIKERGFDFSKATETDLNEKHAASLTGAFGVRVGSGSGGYAEYILREAAKELFGIELPGGALITQKASKSGDLKTCAVSSKDGCRILTFATAYGFRSLQSILRKVRRGECAYNYIELMACPGGCNNGGGQLPMLESSEAIPAKRQATEFLGRVEDAFRDSPEVHLPLSLPTVQRVYDDLLGGEPTSAKANRKLSLSIRQRKTSGMSSLVW